MSESNSLHNKQLDPVEYGMGFKRGETNKFVGSKANKLTCKVTLPLYYPFSTIRALYIVQKDMAKAFDNKKWTLVPEEEHPLMG